MLYTIVKIKSRDYYIGGYEIIAYDENYIRNK